MPAQLLPGYTFSPDGYAINDFESFAAGTVTKLNSGVQSTAGLSWGVTILIERTGA